MTIDLPWHVADCVRSFDVHRLLVGVSGGPDSVCLFSCLQAVTLGEKLEVHIAHLNHGLRGADADGDEHFVKELAAKAGFPFFSHRLDIAQMSREAKMGVEEFSRQARLDFFAEIMEKEHLDALVLAHSLDDQIETMVMNFVRGSGASGLAGMSVSRDLTIGKRMIRIIRPLLGVTHSEVLAYLQQNNLSYRTDSTNEDTAYTRNYIRHEVVPRLLRINPNLHTTLSRSSCLFRATAAYLVQQEKQAWAQIFQSKDTDGLTFSLDGYRALPDLMRYSMMRAAFMRLASEQAELGFERVQAADKMLRKSAGNKTIELGDSICVYKKGREFWISKVKEG